MTIMETTLVFVLIPLVLYGLVALLTLRKQPVRDTRYRPGQEWTHEPIWWTANPAGLRGSQRHVAEEPTGGAEATTIQGGARGNW
nr:hypothetical protein [Actinoalloteichus spitiensis]